jgi:hypothetical protein
MGMNSEFYKYDEIESIEYIGMRYSELQDAIETMHYCINDSNDDLEKIILSDHLKKLLGLQLDRAELMKIVGDRK